MELMGKRIFVTGGAQGIGAALVRAFVSAGADVAVMDLQEDRGTASAQAATAQGPGRATFFKIDVSNRADVDAVFARASSDLGGVDVLVNVAGIQTFVSLEDVDEAAYRRLFDVNVLGTFNTNGSAFKIMRENGGGNIINFGSEAGLTSEPDNAVYGATKGAVHTWTRSAARQWGPHGVRVNAVLPYVVTPMYENFRATMSDEDLRKHDEKVKEEIPLGGKFGDADIDLAPVVVFLASDATRYVTGQLFPVDGGLVSVR